MRLRVLDLPHSGDPADTTTPFLLVLDEVGPVNMEALDRLRSELDHGFRRARGAQGALVFGDRVDLPAVD